MGRNTLTGQECLDFIKENIEHFQIELIEEDDNHPYTHEMFTIKHQHVGGNSLEDCIYNAIHQDNSDINKLYKQIGEELIKNMDREIMKALNKALDKNS